MEKQLETCKNCEKQFQVNFRFCPYCGQQTNDELTVKVLFYNTINNYFSFDARFFKSFLPLLFKPGYLAERFIAGKRLLYLHPAQMYLFITIVFFFLFSFVQRQQVRLLDEELAKSFHQIDSARVVVKDSLKHLNATKQPVKDSISQQALKDTMDGSEALKKVYAGKIDSLVNAKEVADEDMVEFDFNTRGVDSLLKIGAPNELIYKKMGMNDDAGAFKRRLYAQALKFYKSRKGGSILQTFYDAVPFAMFFLLPVFALLLKMLYMKRGLYAHHLVFSFYFFAFLFTVFSLILIINFIYELPGWVDLLLMLSTFWYLLFALKRFYKQRWLTSIFKGVLAAFLFLSLVAPLTVVILGIFAFLFY